MAAIVSRYHDFGDVLKKLKYDAKNVKAYRSGWNGKGIFIYLQEPDENSKMTGRYFYIDTTGLETDNKDAPKNRVPWAPSQTDLMAEDWIIEHDI